MEHGNSNSILIVDLAPVPDIDDDHDTFTVVYCIDDAVAADTEPEQVAMSF